MMWTIWYHTVRSGYTDLEKGTGTGPDQVKEELLGKEAPEWDHTEVWKRVKRNCGRRGEPEVGPSDHPFGGRVP